MQLSEHFTKEELLYSTTAIKYGVKNEATPQQLKVLKHTCIYLLEPLRKLLNNNFINTTYNKKTVKRVYISITSGLRTKIVNSLLKKEGYKPSDTSQHCTGEAVDIQVVLVFKDDLEVVLPYTQTYSLIKLWVKMGVLSVDQCIQEKQGSQCWVHVSHSAWGKTKDRKHFLKFDGKNYINDF